MADDKHFTLEVVTPERVLFTGPVTALVAPAEYGYLGVLANHAPLIATLVPGKITFRHPEGPVTVFQCERRGLLEVRHNRATLLAERIAS